MNEMEIDRLQRIYDDLLEKRSRQIKLYDSCPDGDPARVGINLQLGYLNDEIRRVEDLIDQELGEWVS